MTTPYFNVFPVFFGGGVLERFADDEKSNIRKSLLDMESELMQQSAPPAQPSPWQGTASYINHGELSRNAFHVLGCDAPIPSMLAPSRSRTRLCLETVP